MTKALAIYRRELAYYFQSPVAYAVLTVFVLLSGWFFYNLLGYFNLISIQTMQSPLQARSLSLTASVLSPLWSNMSTLLLLLLPMVTMRLFTEERRSGTAELLFTYPVADASIIAGKVLAAATLLGVMLALTLPFIAVLARFASPEPGPIVSGYLGLALLGIACVAMGTFFSALTDSQVVAGALTFGTALLFLVIGWVTPFVPAGMAALLDQLSLMRHMESFSRGVIDVSDVSFYLCLAAFFVFLCARALDAARWRG